MRFVGCGRGDGGGGAWRRNLLNVGLTGTVRAVMDGHIVSWLTLLHGLLRLLRSCCCRRAAAGTSRTTVHSWDKAICGCLACRTPCLLGRLLLLLGGCLHRNSGAGWLDGRLRLAAALLWNGVQPSRRCLLYILPCN